MQTLVLLVILIKDYSYKMRIVLPLVHQELLETSLKLIVLLVLLTALLVTGLLINLVYHVLKIQ